MKVLRLKKNEDKRLRAGHVWIYSNEIDTTISPLKQFTAGEEVRVESHDKIPLGSAYVNPATLIAARLFSRIAGKKLDKHFLIERIRLALASRERLFNRPYYRLVFGESDGLPGLIVDRFGDVFSLQINTAGMDVKTPFIIEALQVVFPGLHSILLRNDSPARQYEGLETIVKPGFGTPPEIVRVEENTVNFNAPLWQGQKTGWFYDHRLNRARLAQYVAGQTVLDVFSYLGGWGISAAKWGARAVTCVDASPLAIHWINENAALNQVADKTRAIAQDAFDALKEFSQAGEKFDVIVLDPPAFVKKQKDQKNGALAYQRLNESAIKLLQPGGILISCSCSMHVSPDEFSQILRRASMRTQAELHILEQGHQGPDHPIHLAVPETHYLKMFILRRIK